MTRPDPIDWLIGTRDHVRNPTGRNGCGKCGRRGGRLDVTPLLDLRQQVRDLRKARHERRFETCPVPGSADPWCSTCSRSLIVESNLSSDAAEAWRVRRADDKEPRESFGDVDDIGRSDVTRLAEECGTEIRVKIEPRQGGSKRHWFLMQGNDLRLS